MSTAAGEAAGTYGPALGDRLRSFVGERGLERARLALILLQLGFLAIIIRQFQIESGAFLRIALLAFGGFLVHYFLPAAYRLPFFALLSMSGIVVVLGAGNAAALVLMGMAVIGICHLPLSFEVRMGLLLVSGGVLAALRLEVFAVPWSSAVWPILGSMFMFRLIVYLYDLRHDKAPVSFWRTVSYFFLLPNVCFPLFPVVDFKTFRRTHVDANSYEVYQVGVSWMLRGLTHLLLYRFLYYYVALAPHEVVAPRDLAQYLITNFLLYLRVSGQFHFVIGMLHLFGFNLPETNHRYCLASSFTDFWRRINIYWKDFMMKVFYYPAYFRLRKLGETRALVLATLFVFFVTWALHSYQWFWLRGSFPIIWQDAVFWGILAALVVGNSLYEMKYGRKRVLSPGGWSASSLVPTVLKTAGTFTAIIVLWSLWTSESFSAWLSLWSSLRLTAGLSNITLALVVAAVLTQTSVAGAAKPGAPTAPRTGTTTSIAVLLALSVLGMPQFYTRLGPEAASFVVSMKSGKLSRLDMARLERGYYEDLMGVNQFNNQLWEVYMQKPLHWLDIQGAGLARFTGDFRQTELVPSSVANDSFSTITTNGWGMRDQEYDAVPASDTYRMSVLGASSTMGWGVEDGETFEAIVEEKLNQELAGVGYARYEILNHGVAGYYPLQQAAVVEKALEFQPRAVLYIATGRELSRSAAYLAEVVRKDIEIPYPELRAIAEKAGLAPEADENELVKRLSPFREELLEWLYRHVVDRCRAQKAIPVWVFLPSVEPGPWMEETAPATTLARDSGFEVIDLGEVFANEPPGNLRVAAWDEHPNAHGHRLVAERLYDELRKRDELLGLRPPDEQTP
jgi:D-alanyl-lipoteichoic acid acyltransferase DltB (MBOAT superfamily)